jgi:MacB-like periplasmic core domain
MKLWSRMRCWSQAIWQRSRAESEMDAELRFHINAYADDLIRVGISREEALRRAGVEFGGIERAKEECRDARGINLIESLVQDLRFGLRMLRKSPSFTCVAIVTLALGIGANTLVFSVVNALLLRPLPVERPRELAFLENEHYGPSQSYPDYKEIRDRNQTFAGLAGYRITPMDLGTNAGADRIWGYLATGNYFDVLGVKPAIGRVFHQSDDQQPGASPYVVLSYSTWQSRFGSDPAIVGKTIHIIDCLTVYLG